MCDDEEPKEVEYCKSRSFSGFHSELLDLVFKRSEVPNATTLGSADQRSLADLRTLCSMVKMEFAASMEKEQLEKPQDAEVVSPPNPFDVYLMDAPFSRSLAGRFMVCMPMSKPSKELMWMDIDDDFWPIDPKFHIRRIASLSGPARVLENLASSSTLKTCAMNRELLVNVVSPEEADELLDNRQIETEHLNESQRVAVATLISGCFKDGFLVIQGPPGCGKTSTLVGMISVLSGGIVVAAPSNAAVANVALKLFMTGRYCLDSLCVFGESCHDSAAFLNPTHRGSKYQEFYCQYEKLTNETEKGQACRRFARWLHLDPDKTTLSHLAEACPFYDRETPAGRRALVGYITSADVLFCTLNSSGSSFLRNSVGYSRHTLLLDEGGQCAEAEFYIATTFPGIRRIVVVGDPQQLPATVINPNCEAAGYGVSWMGHVFEYWPRKVHLLDTQYRMDPEILAFPNKTFYSNRILSGANVYDRSPHVAKPFCFIDMAQRGREEKDGYSWKNTFEATVIKSILKTDPDILRIRSSNVNSRIIVITPYRAQVQLLKYHFANVKGLGSVEVATVDSFQGQEGDIVVISSVRTKRVGFIDSAERLNVAITRAKKVLRIVGDATFFLSLPRSSILQRLVKHADQSGHLQKTQLSEVAWAPPNWKQKTLWKPVFTQSFKNHLSKMNTSLRNICLHTFKAIVTSDVKALHTLPIVRNTPFWYTSALKGHAGTARIVWIVHAQSMSIQAHFAGSHHACLQFIQKHRNIPNGAGMIKRDLTALLENQEDVPRVGKRRTALVWQMTNSLQNSIHRVQTLPQGNFFLDPHQNEIVEAVPPLMIESRSGTGKTNVLFQHALAHAKNQAGATANPICFVTVSPRLAKELECRFDEINRLEGGTLPRVCFYSFRQLLEGLLSCAGMASMSTSHVCRFMDYVNSRTSHQKLPVETSLIENEIGGVIMGSLHAATEKAPLTLDEYMMDKRSNVKIGSQEGKRTRRLIYDTYLKYAKWKKESFHYDTNDLVFALLDHELGCHFDCAYLDEVQDFPYSAIYLILSLAGKETLHWVCAGDTAQMISPGCSFTFDGLKQTMLAVRGGIESRLSNVHHLLQNYRTTRDVLMVGNDMLRIAKLHFPDSIEYALPEVAMKDLGLKVVLCDWDAAARTKVAFGRNQALIYSSNVDVGAIDSWARRWLGDHPLTLTSMDSKGLEFDDVVVAFDFDRKVWDIARKRVESLRLLRELYVAVTRAKRRVVLLVKTDIDSMKLFFQDNLNCDLDFVDAKSIMAEFDTETTSEEWFEKGREYFRDGKNHIASSCFAAARVFSWAMWSAGLHEDSSGQKSKAVVSYRRAARFFGDVKQYTYTFDLLAKVRDMGSWDHHDDALYNEAIENLPHHLNRSEIVKFALKMESWDSITVVDLTNLKTVPLLRPYRKYRFMQSLIDSCSDDERQDVERTFPSVVASWCQERKKWVDAVMLYLAAGEPKAAEEVTEIATNGTAFGQSPKDLPQIVQLWTESVKLPVSDGITALLIKTFKSPLHVSESCADDCIQRLGAEVIKLAIKSSDLEDSELHRFHKTIFHKEVIQCLETKFSSEPLSIVKWFFHREDNDNATSFSTKKLKSFKANELVVMVDRYGLRPGGLVVELENKKVLDKAATVFLREENCEFDLALQVCDLQLKTLKLSEKNAEAVLALWKSNAAFQATQYLKLHSGSKTAALWNLFSDPAAASKTVADQCMKTFGKAIVQKAVLLADDSELEPLDVLAAFHKKSFGSLNRANVVGFYQQYGRKDKAASYVERHLRKWTNSELSSIVWEQSIRTCGLSSEFVRRNLILDGVQLALSEGNFSEAYRLSEMALSTRKRAEQNSMKLLTLLEQPGYLLQNATMVLSGSRHSLLRRFWYSAWNVRSTEELDLVLIQLGPNVMRSIMKHPFPEYCSDDVMSQFFKFHTELQKKLKSTHAGNTADNTPNIAPSLRESEHGSTKECAIKHTPQSSTTESMGDSFKSTLEKAVDAVAWHPKTYNAENVVKTDETGRTIKKQGKGKRKKKNNNKKKKRR